MAYDFTVKGGSIGYTGEEKVDCCLSARMALKAAPGPVVVWFIDSGGARIDPGSSHPGHDLALRRLQGTCSASRW